ncbi:hypothetical protein N665_1148s0018 [Sinapis alba]|nr:hypothetical protein N665_1148s0018 [Sinapis alba]
MSREDSLAAAQIWSSGADPVVPLSGCRRTSHDVDLFQISQPIMEQRSQPTSSTSPDPESLESHKPLCLAPILPSGPRFQNVTSSYPNLLGNTSISSSLKVTISFPPWCLCDGGMTLLQCISSGDYSFGVDERSTSRPLLATGNALMCSHDWVWPICVLFPVSPRNCFPRPSFSEELIQLLMVFGVWASCSKFFGFTKISPWFKLSYLSFGMYLPVDSSGTLFRSSSSSEDKPLPPYPLSFVRGVSSDLLPSVCSSSYIVLLSCGTVSTRPEDTSEITSVVFVDGVWTPTSHNVTILQLSDFVVKASSTHSSTVSNSLSASCEELSFLSYLSMVVYVCQRGWIIPSWYCIEED